MSTIISENGSNAKTAAAQPKRKESHAREDGWPRQKASEQTEDGTRKPKRPTSSR